MADNLTVPDPTLDVLFDEYNGLVDDYLDSVRRNYITDADAIWLVVQEKRAQIVATVRRQAVEEYLKKIDWGSAVLHCGLCGNVSATLQCTAPGPFLCPSCHDRVHG